MEEKEGRDQEEEGTEVELNERSSRLISTSRLSFASGRVGCRG